MSAGGPFQSRCFSINIYSTTSAFTFAAKYEKITQELRDSGTQGISYFSIEKALN